MATAVSRFPTTGRGDWFTQNAPVMLGQAVPRPTPDPTDPGPDPRQRWPYPPDPEPGPAPGPGDGTPTGASPGEPPSGFDPAKWGDLSHTTPKYQLMRYAASLGAPSAQTTQALIDWARQNGYPNAQLVSGSSGLVDFGGDIGQVDVVQGMQGGSPQWAWQPTSAQAGGTAGAGTTLSGLNQTAGYSGWPAYSSTVGGTTGVGATTATGGTNYQNWMNQYSNPPGPSSTSGAPYWQDVNLNNFGSLLEPWTQQFSYPGFQAPAAFAAPTMEEVQAEPGFAMRMSEGQKALERSAAARGTLLTGGTLRALNDYAQGMGENEYTNVYNRRQNEWLNSYNQAMQQYVNAYNQSLGEYQQAYNIYNQNRTTPYNMLSGLAGLGQTSAGQLGSSGLGYSQLTGNTLSNMGTNIGNLYTQIGNANAAGQVGGWNAWSNALGNVGNNLMSYYANQSGYGNAGR